MPKKALIVIDVQNDYFSGGAWALPGAEAALPQILHLIEKARGAGDPVVYIQHVTPESSPVFAKGSHGVQLHAALPVQDGDPLFEKSHPSSFQDTGLQSWLQGAGVEAVDICGFMTQMCCDTTTRSAYEKGYKVRLFSDATAAKDVPDGAGVIPHDVVHKTHLGTLARFAAVIPSDQA